MKMISILEGGKPFNMKDYLTIVYIANIKVIWNKCAMLRKRMMKKGRGKNLKRTITVMLLEMIKTIR